MLNSVKTKFKTLLKTHPTKTKMATGMVLVGTGDLNAQLFIEKSFQNPDQTPKQYDISRTIRLMCLGGFFLAPVQRFWIDLILPKIGGSGSKSTIALKKSLYDSFIFGSIMNSCYVGLNMYLSNEIPKDKIVDKMKREQFVIVVSGWSYWIPVQIINYRLVPILYQMNVTQVMAVIWHSFLSWKAHQNIKNDNSEEEGKDE